MSATGAHSCSAKNDIWLLLRFAVQPVLAAARAVLVELQPGGVVALVLRACVVAVLALGARQVDDDAVGFLCHFILLQKSEVGSQKSERCLTSDI